MASIFKFEKKIGLGEIIALVAIGFTLFTFIKGCNLKDELAINKYKEQANEYRPYLTINPQPDWIKGSLVILGVDTNDGIHVDAKMTIQAEFIVRNIGNVKANIIYLLSGDTNTLEPIIRSKLLNKKSLHVSQDDIPFLSKEILPNDEFILTYDKEIYLYERDKFCIHIIIFYTNDIEHLYDTYHMVQYRWNGMNNLIGDTIISGSEIKMLPKDIVYIDQNHRSKIYTKEEYQILIEYIDDIE